MRTLPIGTRCPECGRSVSESVRAETLQFANPAWLRSIRRGLIVAAMACIGLAISSLPALVGLVRMPRPFQLWHFVRGGLILLWCLGIWWASRPDPANTISLRDIRIGNWLRRLAVITIVVMVLQELFMAIGPRPPISGLPRFGVFYPSALTRIEVTLYFGLGVVSQAILVASVVLLVRLLCRLADREHRRDRYAGFLACVALAAGIGSVLPPVARILQNWMGNPGGSQGSASPALQFLSTIVPALTQWTQYAWVLLDILLAVALLRSCSRLKRTLAQQPAPSR